ncbi:DNA-directed RNA polymerase I subunit RPA49 [Ixodes scapularis]
MIVDESTLHSTATSTLAEIKVAAAGQNILTHPTTIADSILEFIPPQNKDATIPQEVYRIEDIIPLVQNGYLDELAEPFLTADADDVVKWRSEAEYPDYVLQRLGRLSRDPLSRVLEARMLIYYPMLIQVSRLRYTDLKRKDPLPNIDAPLKHILLDTFTLTSKNERGMTSRTFPERMNDKVLAYILVLVLILEDYKYDFRLVQPDTKAANMRMTTLSYALGCHVGSHKLPGSHVTTKFLKLKLPLVMLPSQQLKNNRALT